MDSKPISEIIHRQLLDLNALVQAQQNHIQQQNCYPEVTIPESIPRYQVQDQRGNVSTVIEKVMVIGSVGARMIGINR